MSPTQVLAQSDLPFESRFQYCQLGGHLRYRTRMILAILNLYIALMPLIKFGLIRIAVWKEMSFEEFQDGHHLGWMDGWIFCL